VAAVALGFVAYNIIKIHRTLLVTPAMAAGITDPLRTSKTSWPRGKLASGDRKDGRRRLR